MTVAANPTRLLVVVPTLGQRPHLLARTLSSLKAQRGVVVDVVMVAPQRTDVLTEAASSSGARLILDGGHISSAVNRGFAEATAEHPYAAWIGDDDMLVPDALSRAVAALDARGDAVMSYGDCEYMDVEGRTLFVRRPPWAARWLMQFVPGLVKSETCVFRIEALRKVGGLDEALRYAMDLDLILRLRRFGPALRVAGPTGRFCVHPGSITIQNRRISFAEAQLVQKRQADPWLKTLISLLQPALLRLFVLAARRMEQTNNDPGVKST